MVTKVQDLEVNESSRKRTLHYNTLMSMIRIFYLPELRNKQPSYKGSLKRTNYMISKKKTSTARP
jgi:hypothetical protein